MSWAHCFGNGAFRKRAGLRCEEVCDLTDQNLPLRLRKRRDRPMGRAQSTVAARHCRRRRPDQTTARALLFGDAQGDREESPAMACMLRVMTLAWTRMLCIWDDLLGGRTLVVHLIPGGLLGGRTLCTLVSGRPANWLADVSWAGGLNRGPALCQAGRCDQRKVCAGSE